MSIHGMHVIYIKANRPIGPLQRDQIAQLFHVQLLFLHILWNIDRECVVSFLKHFHGFMLNFYSTF